MASRFLKIAPRLPVADLRKSCDFYTKALGFTVGSSWPKDAPWFALLVRDDVLVQLVAADAGQTGQAGSATISIDVDGAQVLSEELKQQVAIEWGPEVYWYGRREFAVRDPSGNLLIFSEPTDDLPTCVDES
jgi:catechol 2,3-dioxygenase-like lactoylglutathione lyase family enzyme